MMYNLEGLEKKVPWWAIELNKYSKATYLKILNNQVITFTK